MKRSNEASSIGAQCFPGFVFLFFLRCLLIGTHASPTTKHHCAFCHQQLQRVDDLSNSRLLETKITISGSSDFVSSSRQSSSSSLPPIPNPTTNPDDDFLRSLRQTVPKRMQHWMRDSGVIRWIMDSLVWTVIPSLIQEYPWAVDDFLRLTGFRLDKNGGSVLRSWRSILGVHKSENTNGLRDDLQFEVAKHSYGLDKRQHVSIVALESLSHPKTIHRTIVIVHGGAWGSGFPSMYALTAIPFLNAGYSHVALVGYRTFPTATLDGQLDDVTDALECVRSKTHHPMTVIGHSSGSHLLTMAFLQRRLESLNIDQFVALAGVYDIPNHYRWEKKRGVERISPMSAACGGTLGQWRRASPQYLPTTTTTQQDFPSQTLMIHGALDTTVPYTATQRFAEKIGSEWRLLDNVGHSDLIMHLMFGGATQQLLLEWIETTSHPNKEK